MASAEETLTVEGYLDRKDWYDAFLQLTDNEDDQAAHLRLEFLNAGRILIPEYGPAPDPGFFDRDPPIQGNSAGAMLHMCYHRYIVGNKLRLDKELHADVAGEMLEGWACQGHENMFAMFSLYVAYVLEALVDEDYPRFQNHLWWYEQDLNVQGRGRANDM